VKRYLSVADVCQFLSVCKSLVYRLVRDGEIPSTRLGGKILIPEDGLIALLERPLQDEPRQDPPAPSPPPRPRSRQRRRGGKVDLW
jgi:excisionase family DNA binding protein